MVWWTITIWNRGKNCFLAVHFTLIAKNDENYRYLKNKNDDIYRSENKKDELQGEGYQREIYPQKQKQTWDIAENGWNKLEHALNLAKNGLKNTLNDNI